VLDAIDPQYELIAGRILCRADGQEETFTKSLEHLFKTPEERHNVVVVDDRPEVWDPLSQEMIFRVPPFRCFNSSGALDTAAAKQPAATRAREMRPRASRPTPALAAPEARPARAGPTRRCTTCCA